MAIYSYTLYMLAAYDEYNETCDLSLKEQMKTIESKYREFVTNKQGIRLLRVETKDGWSQEDRDLYTVLQQEEHNRQEDFIVNFIYENGSYNIAYEYCEQTQQLERMRGKVPCGAGDRQCTLDCPHFKEGTPCSSLLA